jgi:deazaflavin-dependent oxidoreductase (nitroreductase family)
LRFARFALRALLLTTAYAWWASLRSAAAVFSVGLAASSDWSIHSSQVGNQFWFVSELGEKSQYVQNIKADRNVRVRLGGRWHNGTAHLVPDDSPRKRLRSLPQFNSRLVRAMGTNLLTIPVDLTN